MTHTPRILRNVGQIRRKAGGFAGRKCVLHDFAGREMGRASGSRVEFLHTLPPPQMLEMLAYNGFRWIVTFETACVQTFSRIVAFGGWSSGENHCRGGSDDNLDSHDAVPLRYYSRLEAIPGIAFARLVPISQME